MSSRVSDGRRFTFIESTFDFLKRLHRVSFVSLARGFAQSWLLPLAAGLVIALFVCRAGSAASVQSVRGMNSGQHHCKCGTKCRGESCCCGPRSAETQPRVSWSTPGSDRADGNRCQMNSAPCGDSGLPGSPVEGPFSKSAALVALGRVQPDPSCVLMHSLACRLVLTRCANRIERPPKHVVAA